MFRSWGLKVEAPEGFGLKVWDGGLTVVVRRDGSRYFQSFRASIGDVCRV